ncbi:Metallo-dependent phosphatase [Ascobolus immersus RN42]|uniref:Metallo-dependent phosphatase n=1 Tax=Ascobolus immersus RN42 TaxID=1160509 RepID=A0A3N4I8I3_ASCIM|nr:Metallo-dependent phosphatase [Ascobolus immersus RN42]
MKTPSLSILASLVLSASTIGVLGNEIIEDRLVSRHLQKRFIDDKGNYNISFYHVNDVHSHLDEFRSTGADCTDPTKGCYGGYARIKNVLDEQRPTKKDSLLLNAGDEFQGTMFFTYYKGDKIAETINQLGFDAMALGNHEFDLGDEVLADFVEKLNFPVVAANVKSANERLAKALVPYHIFPEHDLAVVAVTTQTTPDIAKPDKGTTFSDPVKAVQDTVDFLAKEKNITRIVALTHIGFEEDLALAKKTRGVHLIVGGHSHTLLGSMDGAESKYPTIAENLDGEEVFVVTSYRWGEYLGFIDVTYDPSGKILAYNGAPIHLTNSTAQDKKLDEEIESWKAPFEEFAGVVLGESKVELPASICRTQECAIGNLMTDAMLASKGAEKGDLAIINAGGIRADIDAGPVTRGEVLTTFPFGNSLVTIPMKGSDLIAGVEGIVSGVNQVNGKPVTSFFQVSKDVEIVYDPSAKAGSRLVSFKIKGEDVDASKEYNLVTLDFLATGGDSFFEKFKGALITLDTQDQALVDYLESDSPVDPKVEGRIKTGKQVPGGAKPGTNGTTNGTAPVQDEEDSAAGVKRWSWGLVAAGLTAVGAALL